MASNYFILVATRFLFGMGEAGAYPNASGSVRNWFPAEERARAQGFIWGASRIGGAMTPLLVVPLMGALGWRAVFTLFGAVGLAWAGVWFAWYRDAPSQHTGVSDLERGETLGDESVDGHADVPWGQLGRSRQLWLIMAMYCCYAWGSTFYITWLPEYLTKGRGLSEGKMAVFAALPFAMGALGNLAGGFLSDRLTKAHGARVGRVFLGSGCLALSSILLMGTTLTSDHLTAVLLLSLGFGVMDCMLPCAWAICLDTGGRHAGAVSGAMNSAGQAGGFFCNVLFGYLVGWYGNYNIPLVVIAFLVMISSAHFFMIDPTRPLAVVESKLALAEEPQCV
jgi:ACS family glucarate transporter-like MFS transporter